MSKKNYAVFIFRANGKVEKTIQKKKPSYDELNKAVGGYIETIPYLTHYGNYLRGTAYANEEGALAKWGPNKNQPMPFNRRATQLWVDNYPYALGSALLGDIIFYATTEEEAE